MTILESEIEFSVHLDQLDLVLEVCGGNETAQFVEKILGNSDYSQLQFLWTMLQPVLHRDFMYSAQLHHPSSKFTPLSTTATRTLKEQLKRKPKLGIHRIKSTSYAFPHELKSLTTSNRGDETSPSPYAIRRHIQREAAAFDQENLLIQKPLPGIKAKNETVKSLASIQTMPLPTHYVVWYGECWDNHQRVQFLKKLLPKLDEFQLFRISNLLSVKFFKDFIALLPDHVSFKILCYLTPKELTQSVQVSRCWRKMSDHNVVWKEKCRELDIDVDLDGCRDTKQSWKRMYRVWVTTMENWKSGVYNDMDLRGHTNSVCCLALDKRRIASGSMDKTIKLWDIRTGSCLGTLRGHTKGIWALCFFAKSVLISGSFDATIKIWSLSSGKCLRTLIGHDAAVWGLCFRNNVLVSASQDKTAKVWDIKRSKLVHNLQGHTAAIFCVDMDEAGHTGFTSSADRSIKIWNIDTGELKRTIHPPTAQNSVMSVSFSMGFLACSYGETIAIYKLDKITGASHLVKTYDEHFKRVETLKLKVSGCGDELEGILISAGKDGVIKYWDVSKPESTQTFRELQEAINCLNFDDTRIVICGKNNKLRIMNFDKNTNEPTDVDTPE